MRVTATAALISLGLIMGGQSLYASHNDVVEGNPASPVKVLIYDDLQCGDCARFRVMLDERVLPKYGAKVAFIHRDFPLGKHDWARPAAVAARWVWDQDHTDGITIRRELLAEQDHITLRSLNGWLLNFAARNHLDQKGIIDSLTDPKFNTLVDQDRQAAVARGVERTPTVYVGGVALVETILYEDLARALDEALAK
jgi:protein-disulfide isomerase